MTMPTYEYLCEKCGQKFEKFQPMAAKALTSCPKELCARTPWGHGKVKKLISGGAGLIFKGSGFYITDYRSEKYKEAAKKEAAPAGDAKTATPAASSGSDTKPAASSGAETKPAAKPEAKPAKPSKPGKTSD